MPPFDDKLLSPAPPVGPIGTLGVTPQEAADMQTGMADEDYELWLKSQLADVEQRRKTTSPDHAYDALRVPFQGAGEFEVVEPDGTTYKQIDTDNYPTLNELLRFQGGVTSSIRQTPAAPEGRLLPDAMAARKRGLLPSPGNPATNQAAADQAFEARVKQAEAAGWSPDSARDMVIAEDPAVQASTQLRERLDAINRAREAQYFAQISERNTAEAQLKAQEAARAQQLMQAWQRARQKVFGSRPALPGPMTALGRR